MTRAWRVSVVVCIGWLAGCGAVSRMVEEDAGTGVDGGALDAAPDTDATATDSGVDAGIVEPCSTPGTSEMVACGMCGQADRFCTSARIWEYGTCVERAGSVCMPGTTDSVACGMCGTQTARCTTECQWAPSGGCSGEMGVCLPGATDRTTDGCAAGSSRARTCAPTCAWAGFSACAARPTDFDGDGTPYEMDCDDTNAAVRAGSTEPCGMFVCGAVPLPTSGTRTCVGPGWSACERPATCLDGTMCVAMRGSEFETRLCATDRCAAPVLQQRTCDFGASLWSAWGPSCPAPEPATSCPVVEGTCGACGEGLRYEICNGSCARVWTECIGIGCVPGTTRRDATGCPAGEYRVRTCDATCRLGAAGACIAGRPELDVMLLVDVTGSHTTIVTANAMVLAAELVGPLLADMNVNVGVATFADFPFGAYGTDGDLPFNGVLAPTADLTLVEASLRTLPGMSGGDLPEAAVEALNVLAGGSAHPSSRPFACASGREGGGCWRPLADRAIVVITDVAQHNAPHPALPAGTLVSPYGSDIPLPAAPTWSGARTLLRGGGFGLFAIVPTDSVGGADGAQPQFEFLATDLGEDPTQVVVTYPMGTTDLTAAARTMAMRLAAYYGP